MPKFPLYIFLIIISQLILAIRCQNCEKSLPPPPSAAAASSCDMNREPIKFSQLLSSLNEKNVSQIRASLFPFVPPYVKFNFGDHNNNDDTTNLKLVKKLPQEVRKSLRWRMGNKVKCSIVRKIVKKSGLHLLDESRNWAYTWTKFAKPAKYYKRLKQYQKVNIIPGSYQLFHKEKLWKNLHDSMSRFGSQNFDFVPQTYILPQDFETLKIAMTTQESKETEEGGSLWFVKPPHKSEGIGINIVSKLNEIQIKQDGGDHKDDEVTVVQKYIKPMLVNERKFDLRIYVLVTSFNPLRAYLYRNGNVRFAVLKYSNASETLNEKFMHLTNAQINKKSKSFIKNHDIDSNEGYEWSLQTFWRHLEQTRGIDTGALVTGIEDIVIKTLISVEKSVMELAHLLPNRGSAYQLFGFDIGLDENLKPWLFEVNGSPTTATDSGMLFTLKGKLFTELFNIVGYHFPSSLSKKAQKIVKKRLGKSMPLTTVRFDKRLYTTVKTEEETAKQQKFTENSPTDEVEQNAPDILDSLTPDDIRQLITAEDELSQCDGFARIFPTRESHNYLKYFHGKPRYYNILLNAWESKYGGEDRPAGIELLQELCDTKIHLGSIPPSTKSSQQTCPAKEAATEQHSHQCSSF